jgi:predicted rRNA methylase YqxC with S4 and FtsJ domains
MSRSYTVQYVEKTFPLSRAHRELLQKADYDIQVSFVSFISLNCYLCAGLSINNHIFVHIIMVLPLFDNSCCRFGCIYSQNMSRYIQICDKNYGT